jgi:hypothetical protein
MKTVIVMLVGFAAMLMWLAVARAATDDSIANLKIELAEAQSGVLLAQKSFHVTKEKTYSALAPADVARLESEESKYDSLLAHGGSSKELEAQKDVLVDIESHVMKSSWRDAIERARSNQIKALADLEQAKTRVRVAEEKNNQDDSSQAIQPENRTQNGSNFSIRSQRDSENHPPLPSSQ